ncbi:MULTISPECIES: ABC transporter ATP-binding protein [Paenarthrobacter]|uniref:ABC transporter ATP-binding protein n=2 Tax=Paenarthrobacter ureafaciens TaxID=37931 RepID=A0AAX3EGE2_PAEUR|nr:MULTISPECIES: ABC transporter ATP-binding protein [Paenarthrobacter]MDO5865863.1 ABC transporter ATP-binding protein [Paenarthrobacter sp. SD-2]MDO5876957.1 ABC transporter ATP-binding protein [Paenarthrobacter sp. SD-1]QMU83588.1 ABC transporter ATP-binding protein [Paenarthrobacter ureafaciens]UYV92167.1 ABC transporter ATP-binding protein [Paenarthrobacter ureafaciens]UYV96703.1 ABC transporter ATP-binding protein [Paenarthrobacter ureafaciens]
MVVAEQVLDVEGHPCVVVDRAAMEYRVVTSDAEAVTQERRDISFFRRLTRRPNTVTVRALHELSLVVERGESVGIIGRNGSGKSTLMKLICGQVRPSSGAVFASSTPIMLGVNAALVGDLSGQQNVILGCLAMGMSSREVKEKFTSIVELSGLRDSIHLPMKSYSSGMASRLRFAIAASIDPEILLVDEALNTGDAQFGDRSKRRMDQLREQAGCVFIVSHSLDTITNMCSRVVWLDMGHMIMDGDPAETVKAYQDFTGNLAKGNGITAARIRDEARANLQMTEVLARSKMRRSRA